MSRALYRSVSIALYAIILAVEIVSSSGTSHRETNNNISPVSQHPFHVNHSRGARNSGAIYFPNETNNRKLFVVAPTSPQPSNDDTIISSGIPIRPIVDDDTDSVVVNRILTNNDIPTEPITDFSWNIFKSARQPNPIGNLVLSPLILQLALSILQNAAIGSTNEQIRHVTKNVGTDTLSQLSAQVKQTKSRNQLSMSTAIFYDRSFRLNESFAREASGRNVDVVPVQFDDQIVTGYTINNWIANATNDNIKNVFKADNAPGLRMLLANAIYFRGFWKNQFNESVTHPFYTTDRLQKEIPYMQSIQLLRTNAFECSGGAQGYWVEIPYEGNEFSMLLIVPTIRHQLENLIRQMETKDITDIINQFSYSYRSKVDLKMPKFSIQSSFSLVNTLLKMGLVDLFTINAQLPYLTSNHEQIKIDDILQDAVFQVDAIGTIAAAAQTTSVVTLSISNPPEKVSIFIDQPFLAVIVDRRNKVPLFIAKIIDP